MHYAKLINAETMRATHRVTKSLQN